MIGTEELYWNERYNLDERQTMFYFETLNWIAERPCHIYKPKLIKDGDKWCALFGDDLQSGISGYGNTPKEAFEEFDRQWNGG